MLEFEAAHLGGYDQTDLFTGKGRSKRHEVFYSAESTLGAVRIDLKYRFIDQPNGWFGSTVKPGWSILVNLRLDPYERAGLNASINYYNWYAYEFWRFVFVKDEVTLTHPQPRPRPDAAELSCVSRVRQASDRSRQR